MSVQGCDILDPMVIGVAISDSKDGYVWMRPLTEEERIYLAKIRMLKEFSEELFN